MKKRRIEYEKYRIFLNHPCANATVVCEIPVECSPDKTWIKPVALIRQDPSVVDRTDVEKPLGRSPGVHLGQNQGLARL